MTAHDGQGGDQAAAPRRPFHVPNGSGLKPMSEMQRQLRELCEDIGCEWTEAGGGLLICARCEDEKWEDADA